MLDTSTFFLFLGASMALTIAPGPDNLFVLTQGITRGRKAALFTAWGMGSGIIVHTTAAALGISAIIYSSGIAFQVLKFAGAAYLFYLAIVTFLGRKQAFSSQEQSRAKTSFEMYGRGFLMNVLNPKVGLFFLAFLPQFVDTAQPDKSWIMMQLGFIFLAQAFVIFSIIALFTGSIGTALNKNPAIRTWLSILASGTYAALGLKIALEHR